MTPSGGIKRSRDEKDETSIVKRVRFAHSVSSTSSIYLSIATNVDQVEAQKLKWFGPTFTYHTFGIDEVINGYKELNIFVTFNGFDFQALLDVKYKEKEDTADDVVSKMLSSLPHDVYLSKDEFAVALSKAAADFTCPPGNCIETYATETVIKDGEEQSADKRYFEIYECKLDGNEPAQKLLANLQTLSLWFIEGADAVDVTDPRWVLYLTYERTKDGSGPFCPVGFITVFKFCSPLGRKAAYCKSDQNKTRRICQALVFPTYQRQGHAERLVHCIHAQAMSNSGVYELTVEDPVPGFSCVRRYPASGFLSINLNCFNGFDGQLRDLVDLKNCVKHDFFCLAPEQSTDAGGTGRGTATLTIADIHAVQRILKLTRKQVQTCYEARKLMFVDLNDEIQRKKYRLEVKKRLYRMYTEELDGMSDAECRKAFLETEYKRLEGHYQQMALKLT